MIRLYTYYASLLQPIQTIYRIALFHIWSELAGYSCFAGILFAIVFLRLRNAGRVSKLSPPKHTSSSTLQNYDMEHKRGATSTTCALRSMRGESSTRRCQSELGTRVKSGCLLHLPSDCAYRRALLQNSTRSRKKGNIRGPSFVLADDPYENKIFQRWHAVPYW